MKARSLHVVKSTVNYNRTEHFLCYEYSHKTFPSTALNSKLENTVQISCPPFDASPAKQSDR